MKKPKKRDCGAKAAAKVALTAHDRIDAVERLAVDPKAVRAAISIGLSAHDRLIALMRRVEALESRT